MKEQKFSYDFKITVDTSIEDVLRLDKEGASLFFESKPGRFLDMQDGYKQLSESNKRSYETASASNRVECERETKNLKPSPVSISGRFMRATDKLTVKNKQKGRHYAAKRPDELPQFEDMGYSRLTPDMPEKTYNPRNVVGKAGEEELVWMYTDEENYQAYLKDVEEKSKRQARAPLDAAQKVFEEEGGAVK